MAKFLKRIKKSGIKQMRNIIVLGSAMGYIEDFLSECNNVFVLSETFEGLKRRNLIYRDNFDAINVLPEIDLVLVDKKNITSLEKCKQILLRYSPIIIIEGEEYFSKQEYNSIAGLGYRITDLSRGVQVWKMNP